MSCCFTNVTKQFTQSLNEIYAIAHNHAQVCCSILVVICKTERKSKSLRKDLFFDLLTVCCSKCAVYHCLFTLDHVKNSREV